MLEDFAGKSVPVLIFVIAAAGAIGVSLLLEKLKR